MHNELQHAADKNEGIGAVDSRIKDNVNANMQKNHAQLDEKKSELEQRAEPFKERVAEKVKGQVIGSIDPMKGSLMEKIKNNESPLDFYKGDKE